MCKNRYRRRSDATVKVLNPMLNPVVKCIVVVREIYLFYN
jgi:hypothetical protein